MIDVYVMRTNSKKRNKKKKVLTFIDNFLLIDHV
jgi:hypothetical protein